MTSTRFDPFAQTTGGLVTQYMNTPLEPDEAARLVPKGRPLDAAFLPRTPTVTGDNVPSSSRPYLNQPIDRATADAIARGRARPRATPDDVGEKDTKVPVPYQVALAELRRKFGYAPDDDETDNR
jgi:hypothetical protein